MLKLEMDVVVKEYVMRMMSSIVLGPERLVELPDRVSDRMEETLLMSFLASAVLSGGTDADAPVVLRELGALLGIDLSRPITAGA